MIYMDKLFNKISFFCEPTKQSSRQTIKDQRLRPLTNAILSIKRTDGATT